MPDTALPPELPVRVPLVTDTWGVWRSLRAARENVLSIIPEIATRQPIVSGRTGGRRWHMVMDPESLRHILRDRLDDYPKSVVTKSLLGPAIGDSLFIAEGAHWKWQRRTAAPVFSHRNVTALAPVMTLAAERACDRIAAGAGQPMDMAAEMVATTFEVISDVTFSGGEGLDSDAVHRAIDAYIDQAARVSLFDILGLPGWLPRPGRLMKTRAVAEMQRIADSSIAARRLRPNDGVPDLLDLLLAGKDPDTRRQMTTPELRDNLLTFIVAGHETTALALGWSLYLCAFAPDEQEAAAEEAAQVLAGRAATVEDLANLTLTRRIVDEALRLYPPAAFLSRTALAKDTLAGREILPGETVMLPIYALHRNRLLWDEPDAFRPARFADPRAIDRFAYLPFGDGPRICIGASFALQEAVIVLATLLSRFRFARVKGRDPRPVMILTLRAEGGVWLTAEPRV